MSAKNKMTAARTALVLDQPFFGALALRLRLREDASCATAWTDGRELGYDPAWIETLTHAQITTLVAHEVMHCANGHPWRRDDREIGKWNVACDMPVNEVLSDAGFSLPESALLPGGDQCGKSAEWIYARLPEPLPDSGETYGEVRDAPSGADPATGDAPPTEADWQQAVAQAAAAAKTRGKLPASLDRIVSDALEPRVDWRAALRRFVQERARADYSWTRPNRRYVAQGLYLPALESTELGEIAVAIDTSGSMDDVALRQARAELEAVIGECQPAAVTVYYCDAAVAASDRFERGEAVVWRPRGGGGTDFRPVFAACEQAETPPACLIYISDLDGEFPPPSTEIPTLWVTDSQRAAPIGETIRLEDSCTSL